MALCVHEHSIRTPFPLSHIQVACNGVYIALPFVRTSIGIWSLQSISSKPLELEGHRQKVSCLTFSVRQNPTLLCSAAEDYVIIWNVEKSRATWEKGDQVKGRVVAQNLGPVQYCSFSPDDRYVAVCAEEDVFVLDIERVEVEATLEGHDARVSCAEFCPHYTSTLVSAGEDRTFKIWNLKDKSLIYQSAIISSSPFISIAMCPNNEQFALGTADGLVRIYDLGDGNGFRCLHHIDVQKLKNKKKEKEKEEFTEQGPVTISSRPTWQQPQQQQNPVPSFSDDEDESEVGCAVLGLYYTHSLVKPRSSSAHNLPFLEKDNSLMTDLLDKKQMLIIGTTGSVVQVNSKTLEPYSFLDFLEPVPSVGELGDVNRCIAVAGCFSFAQSSTSPEETWCIVGSLLQNVANILRIQHPADGGLTNSAAGESAILNTTFEKAEISVLSSSALCANSPLKAELVPKAKEPVKKPTKTGSASKSKKPAGLQDQALTFKGKIKSSGYTEVPRKTMFQPRTGSNASSSPRTPRSGASGTPLHSQKEYPMNKPPPTELVSKLNPFERPTPCYNISFSGDGQLLACALSNASGHVFKMPLNGKGYACAGHNGIVRKVHWSCDSQWLLTSSDDKTACIWSRGQGEPIMNFNTVNHNFAVDKDGQTTKVDKSNPLFSKEIKHAQFYYMDKFVILVSSNTFHLYKYHLDPTKASDVKRYLTKSRYKLVNSYQMAKAQQISSLSAINSFYSYIVMIAGTNKSLEIFDMNTAQSIRTLEDVHTRPVHTICQNEGSAYVSHPGSAYDLFLTAAASDCIKLWDLRTNRCVHRYEGHMNRTHTCGIAFSPCARYIASGSEDKSAYIFDTRTGNYFHKLTGHTDVVSDVAFHPVYSQLATSSLDGKFHLYSSQ